MTKSSEDVTTVGVHDAKTNLSKLLRLVEGGSTVQIARGGKPVARLVPIEQEPRKRQLGTLRGRVWMSDDFDAPMTDIEEAIYHGDLFPS